MENYRLSGLERFTTTELKEWLREQGFLPADFEVIGAILFTKYKGEDERLQKMFDNTAKVMEEANVFLEKLRKKNEN